MILELESLKRLFLHEWDPLGVSVVPKAADEYDAYALHVFTLLHQGATEASVAEYLQWVEAEHMGLSSTSSCNATVARRVMQLHAASSTDK